MKSSPAPAPAVSSSRLHGLDHLRALAIIFVLVYHYGVIFPHPEWVSTIGEFGWTGVDLFFVLSGYLIASQLFAKVAAGQKISFPIFFVKRFFRIIPAYVVVVALYFLFPFLREREAPAPLWKYLTFTQNLLLDLRTQGTFSHAWSLCIEEQFYLFFPLILIALVHFKANKKGYWILLLLFAGGFAARLFGWFVMVVPVLDTDLFWVNWQKWIYYPTWCRLDGLLAGVSLAATMLAKNGNYLLLAAVPIFAVAYFFLGGERAFVSSVFGFSLVDIGFGFVVASAVVPSGLLYRFKSVITSYIAGLSYALYLVHKITIHVTQELLSTIQISRNSNTMLMICMAATLLAAMALNRLVEKPFLLWRDKLLNKKSPSQQQPASIII